jgi:hypothetical protein
MFSRANARRKVVNARWRRSRTWTAFWPLNVGQKWNKHFQQFLRTLKPQTKKLPLKYLIKVSSRTIVIKITFLSLHVQFLFENTTIINMTSCHPLNTLLSLFLRLKNINATNPHIVMNPPKLGYCYEFDRFSHNITRTSLYASPILTMAYIKMIRVEGGRLKYLSLNIFYCYLFIYYSEV